MARTIERRIAVAIGAVVRSLFTALDGDEARRQPRDGVEQLERRLPKIAALLEDAHADVRAHAFLAEPAVAGLL